MALPTAQLGSMGGISVPSFVPTQQIDKRPKAWEQALLGLLTSAGSAVLSQGVQNSMAPDYAPQPATGFSKFWNGPTINQARAGELDKMSLEESKMEDNARQERMNRMLAATGQNNARIGDTQRLNAQMGGQINELQHQTSLEDLAGQEASTTASHQHLQDLISQLTATKQGQLVDRQNKLIDVQVPDIQSQTRERNATAGAKEVQTKLMQKYSGDPTAASGAVNPNVSNFAQKSAPGPVRTDPETDAVIALLQGKLGMTPRPAGSPQPDFPVTDEQAFTRQQALQRIFGNL